MKRRILSLSLAVIMVAALVPMMAANANIPASNRGIGFVYMYSASANTTAADAWSGGFNHINGPFVEFDVTRNGTYVLELPPWPRSDNFWIVDNTRVHFLSPANPSGTALPVVVEQIRIGANDRLASPQSFTDGSFWNNDTGTYFGNINLTGGNPVSTISGYNIRQYSVGNIPSTVKLGTGEWDPSAGASSTMGSISQGAIVRVTFRVGTGTPLRYGHVRGADNITAADVTLLRGYVAAQDKAAFRTANPSFNLANADVNGDGFVNSADITLLRRYVAAINKDSVPLGPPPVTLTGTVSVSPSTGVNVGAFLTANTGGLNSQVGLTYRWQRTGTGTDNNFTDITGTAGAGATYTVQSGDQNRLLRVRVSNSVNTITSNQTNRVGAAPPGKGRTSYTASSFNSGRRFMALTFDDGPNTHTTAGTVGVLSYLDGINTQPSVVNNSRPYTHVTFYVNGSHFNSSTIPILQRMILEGHDVDNHGFNHYSHGGAHPDSPVVLSTTAAARANIRDNSQAIYNATGFWPFSFRAPFFEWGSQIRGLDIENVLAFHHANIDSNDWMATNQSNPGQMATSIWDRRADGGIILMHDAPAGNRAGTVSSLQHFIPRIIDDNYAFVTVRQLHQVKNAMPERLSQSAWNPNHRVPHGRYTNDRMWSSLPADSFYSNSTPPWNRVHPSLPMP
jgi:peptidoglycan/xylan/chitin deacetylase (PgdA/CDA1 family)